MPADCRPEDGAEDNAGRFKAGSVLEVLAALSALLALAEDEADDAAEPVDARDAGAPTRRADAGAATAGVWRLGNAARAGASERSVA